MYTIKRYGNGEKILINKDFHTCVDYLQEIAKLNNYIYTTNFVDKGYEFKVTNSNKTFIICEA